MKRSVGKATITNYKMTQMYMPKRNIRPVLTSIGTNNMRIKVKVPVYEILVGLRKPHFM